MVAVGYCVSLKRIEAAWLHVKTNDNQVSYVIVPVIM